MRGNQRLYSSTNNNITLGHKLHGHAEAGDDDLVVVVHPVLHLEGGAHLQLLDEALRLPLPVHVGREILARGQGTGGSDQGVATGHDLLGEWNGDDGLQVVGQLVVHVSVDVDVLGVIGGGGVDLELYGVRQGDAAQGRVAVRGANSPREVTSADVS